MADSSTTTYVFLASRKYPFPQQDFDYSFLEDGTASIAKKDGQQIVALDVTTSFSNSWSADVSKYPVSSGSEISDHLSVRNNTYTLQGVVSDTPIEKHDEEYLGSLGAFGDRVFAAVEILKEMFTSRTPFTLFSEYERINNVVITKVEFQQTDKYALEFTLNFEQVRFAYAKAVTLNVKKTAKKSVASNKNGGGASKQQTDNSLLDHRRKIEEAKKVNLANN